MDDSYSPDLGDEWKNWRVDDPELESDEMKKMRKKHLRNDGGRIGMSAEPADG